MFFRVGSGAFFVIAIRSPLQEISSGLQNRRDRSVFARSRSIRAPDLPQLVNRTTSTAWAEKTDKLEIRAWPGTGQRLELEVPEAVSGPRRRVPREKVPSPRSGLLGLLLGDQAAHPLSQKSPVKRLFEAIVETKREGLLAGLIAG